jgi:hypothetical protein
MPNTGNECNIFRAPVLGTGQEPYISTTGQFTLLKMGTKNHINEIIQILMEVNAEVIAFYNVMSCMGTIFRRKLKANILLS